MEGKGVGIGGGQGVESVPPEEEPGSPEVDEDNVDRLPSLAPLGHVVGSSPSRVQRSSVGSTRGAGIPRSYS